MCTKQVERLLTAEGKCLVEHFVSEECMAGKAMSMDPASIIKITRDSAKRVDLTLDWFKAIMAWVIALQAVTAASQKDKPDSSCSRSEEEGDSEDEPDEEPDSGVGSEDVPEPEGGRPAISTRRGTTGQGSRSPGHQLGSAQPGPSQTFVPVDNQNTAWKLGVAPQR